MSLIICLFLVSIQHQYKHSQWFPCCCCWSGWLWKVHAAVSSSWRNRKTARKCLCKGKVLSSEFLVSQAFSCCVRKMFYDKQHPTLKALLFTIDRYLYTAAFWGGKDHVRKRRIQIDMARIQTNEWQLTCYWQSMDLNSGPLIPQPIDPDCS